MKDCLRLATPVLIFLIILCIGFQTREETDTFNIEPPHKVVSYDQLRLVSNYHGKSATVNGIYNHINVSIQPNTAKYGSSITRGKLAADREVFSTLFSITITRK